MTPVDSLRRRTRHLSWGVLLWSATAVHATEAAHVHGLMRMDIAVEKSTLTLQLDAPLDSLLGFERAPRTAAERQTADALLTRMNADAAALFKPSAAAGCALTQAHVESAALQATAPASPATGGEHADLDASYEFRCAHPDQLNALEIGLFDAFPRLQKIEVQVAGTKLQSKQTLQRPNKQVTLRR